MKYDKKSYNAWLRKSEEERACVLRALLERMRICEHGIECPYCCWEWQLSTHRFGYGQCVYQGKLYHAHRLMYVLWNNTVLVEGRQVLHHCDFASYSNMWHLFLGTAAKNMEDAQRKMRLPYGGNHWNAKLADEQGEARDNMQHIRGLDAILASQFGVARETIRDIRKHTIRPHRISKEKK